MVWSKGLMISNLESVWKVKKDSDITLRQLEEHRSDLCDGGKNHGGTGVGVARAGLQGVAGHHGQQVEPCPSLHLCF